MPTNKEISEAFSNGEFQSVYNHLSEDVEWNIIGDKILKGKAAVIECCDQTAAYFSSVTTKFAMNNSIIDGNRIAIDGTAHFINKDKKSTQVSSCDIYRFENEKLLTITSYCIVTSKK
jgi:ketosteroid isomerase-like protein